MWIRRTFRDPTPSLRLLAVLPWCLLPGQALAQAPTDAPTETPDAVEAPSGEAPTDELPDDPAPANDGAGDDGAGHGASEGPSKDPSEDAAPQPSPVEPAAEGSGDGSGADSDAGSPNGPAESAAPPEPNAAAADPRARPEGERAAPEGSGDPAASSKPTPSPAAREASEAAAPEEEIFISGARLARTPGSAHVIGRQQLERFEYDDSQAILLQVPGVYVRQEDGIGLRPNIGIRGVSPDRSKKLTLMEDGILFGPAPYSAPAAYFFPLMTRMSQVQIIKGPSAIAHGPQTVGGAIDFISRPIPTDTTGGLDLGLGDFGYSKAHGHFGSSDGQTGFLLEGVRLQNTGFTDLPSGADTGSTRYEWVAKASHVLDPNADVLHEFRFKLAYSDEVSNETYLGQTDADFRADPYRRYAASALDQMKSNRLALTATHVLHAPDAGLKLTTSAYKHEMSRSWNKLNRLGSAAVPGVLREPDALRHEELYGVLTGEQDTASPGTQLFIGPNARTFVSQGVQTRLDLAVDSGSLSHRIEAGLRLHHDSIARRHSESAYDMVAGRLVHGGEAAQITAKNEAQTHALALHALDAITWRNLTLTPGVRVELLRQQTTNVLQEGTADQFIYAVLPGMGAFYDITETFGLLAGVHRGFSPPAPPEPGANGAAPAQPRPEYSVNYETGGRFKSGATTLELIGFFNDYSNLTSICTIASGCVQDDVGRQVDVGAAHIYGLEAFAAHELPAGPVKVPFTVAYTLTKSSLASDFASTDPSLGNVRSGDELPYLPLHQLVATVGVETGRVGGVISANYISRMHECAGICTLGEGVSVTSGDLMTDSQFWLDAGASWRALRYLSFYANLRNVLGAENLVARRPYGARPNAPRWLQVGAKLDF